MSKIILPKYRVDGIDDDTLFFLAGPIRGAPQWQDKAIDCLLKMDEYITIASPRRKLRTDLEEKRVYGTHEFPRQRAWEWHYLKKAGKENKNGAIIFWFPGEVEHRCEKSYGAMTRAEFGQWMTRFKYDGPVRLSIGTDGKFSEFDTLLYDLHEEYKIDLPIFNSLEETCRNAMEIARG